MHFSQLLQGLPKPEHHITEIGIQLLNLQA